MIKIELKTLKPERVFHHFSEISKIPRGSKNEKEISDYLMNFAKSLNLEVVQDNLLNILIKKPATKGYNSAPTVILQGHMDIVCEKEKDSNHDFLKDPIELIVDGDYLHANKTTLGADNGIAVAMALSILEDETLIHPPLEILITTDEETEMTGALGLSPNLMSGKLFINIDSEEDHLLTVGSAGGILMSSHLEPEYEEMEANVVSFEFSGLLGGHSGIQINDNKGNIIKIIGDFLNNLNSELSVRIASIESGSKDNTIPREGNLKLIIEGDNSQTTIESILTNISSKITEKYKGLDGDLSIKHTIKKETLKVMSKKATNNLINILMSLPTGVANFVKGTDFPETSNNIAIIKNININNEDKIIIHNSIRSSNKNSQQELVENFSKILKENSSSYELSGEYPAWAYKEDSFLRDKAKNVYFDLYNKEFETLVIHAGLECGAIFEKYPNMDMISIGPNIYDPHTPKEKMSISSAKKIYEYLLKLLEEIAKS